MRRRALLRAALGASVAVGGASATPRSSTAPHRSPCTRPPTAPSSSARPATPDPYAPLGRLDVPSATEAVVGPDGEWAYVAVGDGFATVDVSDPTAPTAVAERTNLLGGREGGPLREILDVSVDGDRLLVPGPANYHGEDALYGFALYDVRDPATPRPLASYETGLPVHNATLRGDLAYLVDSSRLVIVDVSGDPREVGTWTPADHDPAWADVDGLLAFAHDVSVQEDRAYVSEWDAGTFVLDVSDPAAPRAVTRIGGRSPAELAAIEGEESVVRHSLGLPGNHHTSGVNEDGSLLVLNQEAWETELGPHEGDVLGDVELWDLTDERAPRRLATIDAPPSADPRMSELNTTPHNFEVRADRLYTSWYDGGVMIHDIADPASPKRLAWWRAPEQWTFWTAQYATEEFFVASSHSYGEYNVGTGALFTFPNRPGQQRDPPPLTETPEPTIVASPTPMSPTPADVRTPSPTPTGGSPSGIPGFGALAALGGLALAAWRWEQTRASVGTSPATKRTGD